MKLSTDRGSSGFSLIELTVTLAVMVVAVIGALTFFDISTKLAKTQLGVAQLQSSHRAAQMEMVRMLSMAGIGGLPDGITPAAAIANSLGSAGVFPTGLALSVLNNAPPGTDLGTTSDPVLVHPGTDVLTLRGVFSTPVYYIEPPLDLVLNGDGEITISLSSDVDLGVSQDLEALRNILTAAAASPEAFIIYDRFHPGAFAVMEYDATGSALGAAGSDLSINLSLGAGATHEEPYGLMALGTSLAQGAGGQTWTLTGSSSTVITLPRRIGAIGLLEEYRFLIQTEREIVGKPNSRLLSNLVRARFYPGTDILHPEGVLEVTSNIVDLQLALAVDQPPVDSQILEVGANADDDEILYNFPGEDDGLGDLNNSLWADPAARLLFVRLSTVAQANQPDRDFPGAVIDLVEDHDYSLDATTSIFNTGNYSRLRKRLLQTIVEVRNLP